VRRRGGDLRIVLDRLEWIQACRDYVVLHTEGRSHMVRMTMRALEPHLDPTVLLRVHRSAFVRASAVCAITETWSGAPALQLRSGAFVRVSRTYAPRVLPAIRRRLREELEEARAQVRSA
jgi:two-component system LytT family response regulator